MFFLTWEHCSIILAPPAATRGQQSPLQGATGSGVEGPVVSGDIIFHQYLYLHAAAAALQMRWGGRGGGFFHFTSERPRLERQYLQKRGHQSERTSGEQRRVEHAGGERSVAENSHYVDTNWRSAWSKHTFVSIHGQTFECVTGLRAAKQSKVIDEPLQDDATNFSWTDVKMTEETKNEIWKLLFSKTQ